MSNSINILIQAKDNATNTLRGVSSELDKGAGSIDRANTRWQQLGDMAKWGALAVGGAAAVSAKYAIDSAADYEQSLNVFRSVSEATAEQMKLVAAQARALGQDAALPGVSARDAAMAMVELSKAGISVNDTLKASKGVLALAKAGQLETAEAASIAANALNAFNLEGSEAGRVADLLAAGANASSADVKDMAYSLQMSAAQAAAVKVPVEDLTSAIALMANNGIKGSDAGTSLKTMFMNLIPTTDRAKGSMKELNLDFYDAQGRFVGMRAAVEQLEKGTAKLTDEQKALHIENIFGADSSRAVNILLKEGVKGYDDIRKAVTKSGAATALATAQNSGFKGALDNLKSSIETVAIDVGSRLLPRLTQLIQTVGPRLTSALSAAGDGLVNFVDEFPRLYTHLTSTTGILPGLAAGFVAYNTIVGAATVKTMALQAAQNLLNIAMRMNPLALVAAGAIGIVTAYANVVTQTDRASSATQRLNQARKEEAEALQSVKLAEEQVALSKISAEQATLAIERAQRTYNEAVRQYGPTSLEAREADLALQRARIDGATATRQLKNDTAALGEENKNYAAKAQAAIAANNGIAGSAYGAASGFQALASAARDASKAAQSGNSGKAAQIQADAFKMPGFNGFATGGYTGSGPTNRVAGVVHAGEYVIPKHQVDQMTGLPKATAGGAADISINFQGPVSMNSEQDVQNLAQRIMSMIDSSARKTRMGVA